MIRFPLSVRASLVLACGLATWAAAQDTSRSPARPAGQPEHSATSYRLQIVPTQMKQGSVSMESGGDHWTARGFDLKSLIAEIYDFDPRRIDFANHELADTRYDITLTTQTEMDEDALQRLVVEALKKKLGLSITRESQALDVYLLTAPNGPSAALHRHDALQGNSEAELTLGVGGAEQFRFEARNCSGVASGGGITASGGTMPEFSRQLEPDLDRPMIDETHLPGGYDFTLGGYANQETLFRLLRDQLGLVVTPARRNVPVLTVRAAGEPAG